MVMSTNSGYLDSLIGSYFLSKNNIYIAAESGIQLIPYIKSAYKISILCKNDDEKNWKSNHMNLKFSLGI